MRLTVQTDLNLATPHTDEICWSCFSRSWQYSGSAVAGSGSAVAVQWQCSGRQWQCSGSAAAGSGSAAAGSGSAATKDHGCLKHTGSQQFLASFACFKQINSELPLISFIFIFDCLV